MYYISRRLCLRMHSTYLIQLRSIVGIVLLNAGPNIRRNKGRVHSTLRGRARVRFADAVSRDAD
eukprot:4587712-Pleurochrysis_carterae.AAC.1